jgi:hypothetical protein
LRQFKQGNYVEIPADSFDNPLNQLQFTFKVVWKSELFRNDQQVWTPPPQVDDNEDF